MPVEYLKETPAQTGGPYVRMGTLPAQAGLRLRTQEQLNVLGSGANGPRIRIEGRIFDGGGDIVRDAIIEIWQADPEGRYDAEGFLGWGRAATDRETGLWSFESVKPGITKWRDGSDQAPHATLMIFARGINIHLHTRLYFPGNALELATDPVLRMIDSPERRNGLVATLETSGDTPTYHLDIRLQGNDETVFFDI